MSNAFSDPNQEVESWKDMFYNEFKKVPETDLANYLEKEADQTLRKYGIKWASSKTIKKPELTPA